ncbi:MAG: EboA domain-containing protein [Bacteroidetes bacterium]|nr:EboA domain-containing protein [Fibrella sp.]
MRDFLFELIKQQPEAGKAAVWLRQQADTFLKTLQTAVFYKTFTAIPRFTGKEPLVVSPEMVAELDRLRPGFVMNDWTLDRLARVWWLLILPADDETGYVRRISELFKAAEMNELVALYSALPVLAFPEAWQFQATEGVRNNIGDVQTAIMLHNPYPADYLDEAAWNQLVLKAFFTDKDVSQITGLDRRNNARLAQTLLDYASERRAAGRSVPDMIEQLVR